MSAYITGADLSTYLGIEDVEDASLLDSACAAATRAVEQWTGRVFTLGTEAETRDFEAPSAAEFYIDDLSSTDDVVVATDDGTGAYATALAETDYQFLQDMRGGPYTRLRALGGGFPQGYPYGRTGLIRITGIWGWTEIPEDVIYATKIQAARLFHRRNSPQGVAGFGEFGAIRLSKADADFEFLLNPYRINFGIA